jgi:hypothetical protein
MVEMSLRVPASACVLPFVPWTPFACRDMVGGAAVSGAAEKIPQARNISHNPEVACLFA